jgi:hypothetical protein
VGHFPSLVLYGIRTREAAAAHARASPELRTRGSAQSSDLANTEPPKLAHGPLQLSGPTHCPPTAYSTEPHAARAWSVLAGLPG